MSGALDKPRLPSTTMATVTGRACGELVFLRTESARTLTVRVGSELWRRLDLGQEARVTLGPSGRPDVVEPIDDRDLDARADPASANG
jgi:hypothetical protein